MPRQIDRLPFPYRPEADVLAQRLAALDGVLDWATAASVAAPWVQAVRDNPPPFWAMESLLKEYPISSAEGLALMRLAEALLRVPDAETAIALTADQLGRADFDGAADSALARLSSSAIALSKKFLPGAGRESSLMAKLGSRSVVAATLRAVQLLGRQFVLGQTIEEGMKEAASARKKQANTSFSFDMLGEGARTDADALRYLASYQNAIVAIARQTDVQRPPAHSDGISIKLSALHPRYEDLQHERVMRELVPRVWTLCEAAARANLNLTIDAEEVDRLELSLDVFEVLVAQVAEKYPQWTGFGLALQSYQTRAVELIGHLATMARRYKVKLMCRLVKGAYWDAEIKRGQELGLPGYPVFTHKHHTDVSYLACAQALFDAADAIYPQFATHNAGTIAAILQMAEGDPHAPPLRGSLPPAGAEPARVGPAPRSSGAGVMRPFELQRLHGMGEGVYREVLKNPNIRCRVYAPVGAHRDLLAYLVRRLLENGANSSFVHQLADESVGMDLLLTSPLYLSPEPAMPLPVDLFGTERRNSMGLDLAVVSMRQPLLDALARTTVPAVPLFDEGKVAAALVASHAAFESWSATPVAVRARALRQTADAMEAQLPALCGLLVKEAFKTWADAVSEVREAVDFLRYYANEAERMLEPGFSLRALGPWVCISPWNFPLAIFCGQVAAALVTGNTVLAKPAEQTPAIALVAVKLLHEHGVPADALQLLHGPGETVGAALVAQPGVAGVVFTGSTQVAKIIQRALAAKDGPVAQLIAETGGINAMLVDSTALPEQVADAVTMSAFRSAGQRCSALRLLCVHESVADGVIEMIEGAAQELGVGRTGALDTDLGPVIDREAFDNIQRHVRRLQGEARTLLQVPVDPALVAEQPNTMAPQMFEVKDIADVTAEIFGPVLQVVRWHGDPALLVKRINALNYGLTMGIQTRIDSRAQALAAAAHVGNVYVNRNVIGAVVGVQPFGGEGLSGTGPKAGGPHYLQRFVRETQVDAAAVSLHGDGKGVDVRTAATAARQSGWTRTSLAQRCAWLERLGASRLAAAARNQLADRALPGPTGESNALRLKPRGVVAAIADRVDEATFEQWLAALAGGNGLVVAVPGEARELASKRLGQWVRAGLPAEAVQMLDTPFDAAAAALAGCEAIDGMVAQAAYATDLNRRMAARDGAVVPLVTERLTGCLWRLCAEQTLTINTTAAGGNVALFAGAHS
jgi:RHH-type transcriptional regulator, proline utilization regulon repressor / proline dehydrogenase / delta 1-pyrroline-5-carboxylate dehydrogenase